MEKPVGTLSKIVYDIKERLTGYFPNDDVSIPDELIEDKILDARAILVRDAWREMRHTSPLYYTPYYDVEVQVRDADVANPIIYAEIPPVIDKVPDVIRYVGTRDGRNGYEIVSRMAFQSLDGRQFTADYTYVNIDGNILYFYNIPDYQKYVRVDAVFYDPRQVPGWDGIIVPPTLIEKIVYIAFNDLLAGLQTPKDQRNDEANITGVIRQATDDSRAK